MAWIFYYKEVVEKSVSSDDMNSLMNKSDNEEGGINHIALGASSENKLDFFFLLTFLKAG